MLGIRLKPEEEEELDRHAKALGRPKSAVVRDWIREKLEKESIDAQMRRTARILAEHDRDRENRTSRQATSAYLKMLDDLDGGYNWEPEDPAE